jgi:hypothetical protein
MSTNVMRYLILNYVVVFSCLSLVVFPSDEAFGADDLQPLLKTLQSVGPGGLGNREAAQAWQELVRADAGRLPTILAGLDDAGPLASNWIATAVDAVAERQLQSGGKLPAAELERFVLDARHAPKGRSLAYQWLSRVDSTAPRRLLAGMLNDASAELRRDAIAQFIEETSLLAESGKTLEAAARYREALRAARDFDQIALLVQRLRKLGQQVDPARLLGFIVKWKLIGPFDNPEEKGYDTVYPPEQKLDLNASYEGKRGKLRWMDYTSKDDYGLVDLNAAIAEEKGVAAYATAEFIAAKPRRVQFRLATLNAVKLWLNGRLIDEHKVYHLGSQLDHYVSQAELQAGRNVILLKICQNEQTQDWAKPWAFQLRVCDEAGVAVLSDDR